ncbi:hypothetical protein GGD81_002157 [Rhodobium orientis]|uniref:Uncharacterized protein n=1 Tax=Rhodobium orientis TaxID=34017 RepID=A0A327JUR5_9HYPH|nr:hypothetical protein [Rhodobium orientis]MBB4303114.1 hypothetical protein [Rhodobium orientis]MBK5951778.1 hypothetical protein [Rhodobium orientis]RAI26958.1 hypothetical protein CH339_12280 [Rhodobium orientis]
MRTVVLLIAIVSCVANVIPGNAKSINDPSAQFNVEHTNGGGEIPLVDVDPQSTLKPASLPGTIEPLSEPSETARPFSGLWHGQWEGTLDMYLTIVAEDEKGILAFYSWGANAITHSPGMRYIRGVVYIDTLLLPGKGVSMSFQPQPDGTHCCPV